MGVSSNENKAVIGDDGWLFLGNGYESVIDKSRKTYGIKLDDASKNETFIDNVFRILSLPSSTVELNFCKEISTENKTARETAKIARNQVSKVLAENGYM